MDIREHNRVAWDALAEKGDRWTVPVLREAIEAARKGLWDIVLTPTKPVPRSWLDVTGRQVLCLASGGGQQGPILAAAGATVTVLDNSPKQLERDADLILVKSGGPELPDRRFRLRPVFEETYHRAAGGLLRAAVCGIVVLAHSRSCEAGRDSASQPTPWVPGLE